MDTLATSVEYTTSDMLSSLFNASNTSNAVSTSSFGTVNAISFRSLRIALCTIISTLTLAFARAWNTFVAEPGLSSKSKIPTFATFWSQAKPVTTNSFSNCSLLTTKVPSLVVSKLERTHNLTSWIFAISTERGCSTFAPRLASSSISSWVIIASLLVFCTIRGSAVYTPSTSV